MNRPTCTRRLEVDAGHRLLKHEGKCRNTHGHRYAFELTCSAAELDAVGRVVDFAHVKTLVGAWLDEHWDHAFIFQEGDPIGEAVREDGQRYFMVDFPPTAENLAAFLLSIAAVLLGDAGIRVERVRCYETPNCWADAVRAPAGSPS